MAESDLKKLARELRDDDDDDEITAEHLIEAMQAGAAVATARHKAMTKEEAEEVTPTDRGKKSEPPRSGFVGIVQAGGGVVVRVVQAVNNPYALLALALLVAGFVAWLKLHR